MDPAAAHRRPLWRRGPATVGTLLPGLPALRTYRRGWLRGDVLAGVTVAAYLVPQVMAYAQIAGLPPATGLLAVVGPVLAYALLGSSRRLSVGPESTTALMTATALAAVGVADGADVAALAAALAVVTGALCVLGWVLGLGFLADLLSRPVLVGYMLGIAGLMVASQLATLTGVDVEDASAVAEAVDVLTRLGSADPTTLVLALGLLAGLLLLWRFAPRVPGPLLVVLAGAALVAALDLDARGVEVVGPLPDLTPRVGLPDLSVPAVAAMLPPALGIAVVAYTDNVLTARAFERPGDPPTDGSQEFLALGAANVLGGLLGGFPASSSGSRTAIGAAAGSHTQVFSLVALLTVLTATWAAAPVVALFPTAALGALVVYAALRLVDVAEVRRVARFRRSELVILLLTAVGVLALGALDGILLAVALSVGDLLRRVARAHDGILGFVPGTAGMHDVDDFPDAEQVPGLVVYRYDSPLFFANADDFRTRALAAVDAAADPVAWLVVNTEANVEVDLTALDALEQLRSDLERRGVVLALARVKQDLRVDLERSGLADRIGRDHLFPTLPTAVAAFRAARGR